MYDVYSPASIPCYLSILRKWHVRMNNDDYATTESGLFLFDRNVCVFLTRIICDRLYGCVCHGCLEIIDDLITFCFVCQLIEISNVCCKSLLRSFIFALSFVAGSTA